jgi:hypothetical protein
MANTQIESKIRDWLADNLSFIENGLQLIRKEFPLPDNIGAKGFVDLLCKDIYNNFVIIEIKRSNTSARQTITEVFKYHSLIKHNFKARESEIRIVIISTHWNELIRAYSEIYHKTNIALKGYKIEIDTLTSIPISISLIEPLKLSSLTRKFAFWQGLYLFKTIEKRELFQERLRQRLSLTLIEDYVSINIDGPLENKKILTPYAIVAAFQKQPVLELLRAIETLTLSGDTDVMDRADFDDEISYQRHLEDAFIAVLAMYRHSDDAEAGYSEKLDGMLNNQGWTVKDISRCGIFKTDPRYDDNLLIKELRGHDGNNQNKFVGFAESTQFERIKEIQQECMNSLMHTPQWAEFIECFFKELEGRNQQFRLFIDIYNPDSIITSFYFTMINANPDYLPIYRIFVDYIDCFETEVYIGELYWNQRTPTAVLFNSTNNIEIANEVIRLMINPENEMDSIKMALLYTNKKIVISDNKEIFNGFVTTENDKIVSDNTKYNTIQDYIIYNKQSIMKMISNYKSASQTL